MRSILFFIVLYFCHYIVNGQEFVTKLYFQDAKMHYDTLVVGYDQNATDSIDKLFGEKNINGTPFDSIFEVRSTDQYKLAFKRIPYLSKTQIVKKQCEQPVYPFVYAILVKCKYYPLKIKWDKALFNDSCRNYSLITDWNPGGWFDAGGGQGPYYLKDKDSVSFPYINDSEKYDYIYNDVLLDTVRLLYFTIASKQNLITNAKYINNDGFSIFPTLVHDKLFVKLNSNSQIDNICFVDLQGKLVLEVRSAEIIDVSSLHRGMFIVNVKIKGMNTIYKSKVIKF